MLLDLTTEKPFSHIRDLDDDSSYLLQSGIDAAKVYIDEHAYDSSTVRVSRTFSPWLVFIDSLKEFGGLPFGGGHESQEVANVLLSLKEFFSLRLFPEDQWRTETFDETQTGYTNGQIITKLMDLWVPPALREASNTRNGMGSSIFDIQGAINNFPKNSVPEHLAGVSWNTDVLNIAMGLVQGLVSSYILSPEHTYPESILLDNKLQQIATNPKIIKGTAGTSAFRVIQNKHAKEWMSIDIVRCMQKHPFWITWVSYVLEGFTRNNIAVTAVGNLARAHATQDEPRSVTSYLGALRAWMKF